MIYECLCLQAEASKKRPAGFASKTPVPEKKAKLVSPGGNQKTGRHSMVCNMKIIVDNISCAGCTVS